jgi:hypothetical protein
MLSITVQERGHDMHVAVQNWAGLFVTLFISLFSAQFCTILKYFSFPTTHKNNTIISDNSTATDVVMKSNVETEFTPDIL